MGAQIILYDGFEVIPPPEMNDLLLFGSDQSMSNADASTVTTEEESTVFSGESSPAGVAEEEEDWPTEKPFRFYFVKQPFYNDPEIKSKIDEADHEIYLCNKRRIDISNLQKSERAEFSSLITQMESLVYQYEGYKVVYEEKKKEFETVQESLKKLCCSSTGQVCFTKEELDHLMNRAYYPIEEEDWVLKDVETTLSDESLTQKEAYIQRFKSVAVELNEVKREQDAFTWKINQMSEKLGKIQQSIAMFDVEMAQILDKRDKAFQRIKTLRIQRDKGNAAYYQNIAVMKKAKELAASGNARDLEEFASSEVDKFMCHWNNDKAFRDEYQKRISSSLDERQLSRDGRIRNLESEKQFPIKTKKEGVAAQSISSNSSQDGINVATDKQKKEVRKKVRKSSTEESDVTDIEFPVYEKPCKEEEEVDEETLKQRKREEQLEKARLAMERKKKRQEKTAAKAAIKAQKEAEKKLKECEKKAKKKAAANEPTDSDRPVNSINETSEVEKEKCLVSVKEKHQKERSLFPKQRSFRYKHRGRGTEALPKAILNRRRAHRYWIWGCSAAALAFALFLVVLLLR